MGYAERFRPIDKAAVKVKSEMGNGQPLAVMDDRLLKMTTIVDRETEAEVNLLNQLDQFKQEKYYCFGLEGSAPIKMSVPVEAQKKEMKLFLLQQLSQMTHWVATIKGVEEIWVEVTNQATIETQGLKYKVEVLFR